LPHDYHPNDPQRRQVNKLQSYIKFAAECREMARTSLPSHRLQLLQMAETWDLIADARRDEWEKLGKSEDDDK
jgi:hypothetical protein